MNGRIEILDTTLRDGGQGEGIAFSIADKLAIAAELDALGVSIIEGGNPAAVPKDREFFEKAQSVTLKNARLAAFGATRHKDTAAETDSGLTALIECGAQVITIFGKASRAHIERILGTTPEENVRMIEESCRRIKSAGREVIFDAEHFFDGWREDRQTAQEALNAAIRGGADVLVLCDTRGGCFPDEISRVVGEVRSMLPDVKLGIHCHNDCGLAVAGSMAAVSAGATHVQGPLNGIGERCGNTCLATLIPNLQLKLGYSIIPDCSRITAAARAVAEICNVSINRNEPYIGRSAFVHKAGMHADAVLKDPASFEHIPPESVGNKRHISLSELSGRGAVLDGLRDLLPDADKSSGETTLILDRLKQLELQGYQFEGAHASLELMAQRCIGRYKRFFELRNYRILCVNPHDPDCSAAAMVKVRVGENEVLRSAEGDGPVHALDKALRLALRVFYPSLAQMRLSDFKVRVMDSRSATAATVRVTITSTDGRREWSTVGVSADIIEASFAALCDSVEYKLMCDEKEKSEK